MKKCKNCECENPKDAKECIKCGSKFIFGIITYKPQALSIYQKLSCLMASLICILIASGLLYLMIQEVIISFMDGSVSLGMILLIIVILGTCIPSILIFLLVAYIYYFIAKNSY